MINIRRYTDTDSEAWNRFIGVAKNGLFLFDRGYMDYHKDRFDDHSVMIFKNENLLAVFVACERGEEITSHGGLTFGGLVMDYHIGAAEVLEVFGLLLGYYREAGFTSLVYKATPFPFQRYPSEEDLYALFLNKATLFRRNLGSMVDLGRPLRFSEGKRQGVSKAAKHGVTVSVNGDLSGYWGVLRDVLARHGAQPVHSLEEISLLSSRFPEHIRLYEARRDGAILAGILLFDYGMVAHTQYMANSEEGRKFHALDLICNHLVGEAFRERRYLSWGTSNEGDGQCLNEGLIHQKELMGGRGVAYDFYKIDL